MPGDQYSNLSQQVKSLGLDERFGEVKRMYRRIDFLFEDLIKVTPSSKVVGDITPYMVQNGLDEDTVISDDYKLDSPESVVSFSKDDTGQPVSGFNKKLQDVILKGQQPTVGKPGEYLEPVDFETTRRELNDTQQDGVTGQGIISYILYPKVYKQYI